MRVLITGGTGFIGSHTVEELLKKDHTVSCLSLQSSLPASLSNQAQKIEQIQGNLMDRALLQQILRGIDCVVHLAWSSVPHSTIECPEVDVEQNILGSISLLESCVKAGVKKVVFLSSGGTAYGVTQVLPIAESHPVAPICSYGITKVAVENYLNLYTKLHGLHCTILRAANVYGPRHKVTTGQGVVGVWLDRCVRDEQLALYGDGSTVRDFVYVKDVARAIRMAAESLETQGTVNVGTGRGTSLRELLEMISKKTGSSPILKSQPIRPFDVPMNVLDSSRARALLGWEPETKLEKGIDETWEWMRKRRNKFKT